MTNLIDMTYEGINVTHIVPSFFETIINGILNTQNGSLWGIGFLLVIFMISFLLFKPFGFDKGLITASIINFIASLLFFKANWINETIFIISCIFVVVGIWVLLSTRSQEEA